MSLFSLKYNLLHVQYLPVYRIHIIFSQVIQRFQDGDINFNRNWTDYKNGFGFLSREFWLGNDKLSFLTNQNTYELRTDFTSANGVSFSIAYSKFRITDEYSEYKITVIGEYIGTEGM